jgi:hypothetical protein
MKALYSTRYKLPQPTIDTATRVGFRAGLFIPSATVIAGAACITASGQRHCLLIIIIPGTIAYHSPTT